MAGQPITRARREAARRAAEEAERNRPADLSLKVSPRQAEFIKATATEVLFGGAAGGGKSYGQLIDALLYALRYPGSKQLIFRRTYPDLEKSLIRVSLGLYPQEIYTYNAATHTGKFKNGSLIDFGYSASEKDVYQYQSAEYDVIRFDELTHFTEFQYVYMLSRLRGANDFPKQMKSSTNPGGIGHQWVKDRFIDPAPPKTVFATPNGITRVFIPSRVTDNRYLMESDPDYLKRLEELPEAQRKALLFGDWDIFEGQYFSEWSADIHTCDPFHIPDHWRKYRTFDYGLDRFALLWVAISPEREVFVYREYCESDLPVSAAAKEALERTQEGEEIYATLTFPDIWGRTADQGRSKADLFYENGLPLTRTSNDREAGWLAIHELLRYDEEHPPRLHIFKNCRELIRCLPMLQFDERKPTDCATEPHEITHVCDALRGIAIYWTRPNDRPETPATVRWSQDQIEDYWRADQGEREYLIRKWGKPANL